MPIQLLSMLAAEATTPPLRTTPGIVTPTADELCREPLEQLGHHLRDGLRVRLRRGVDALPLGRELTGDQVHGRGLDAAAAEVDADRICHAANLSPPAARGMFAEPLGPGGTELLGVAQVHDGIATLTLSADQRTGQHRLNVTYLGTSEARGSQTSTSFKVVEPG